MSRSHSFIKFFAFLLVLSIAFSHGGCAKKKALQSETGSQEQTLWRLLDEHGDIHSYLDEDDKDVLEIMRLIRKHIACVDNRSAENIMFEEEAETYSSDFLEFLLASKYDDKLQAMYLNNELAISSVSVIWNPNTINYDRTVCKVDIDSVFQFSAGSDSYLKALGVELNTNYIEHRLYYCEKIDDSWKITNIEKSSLYRN